MKQKKHAVEYFWKDRAIWQHKKIGDMTNLVDRIRSEYEAMARDYMKCLVVCGVLAIALCCSVCYNVFCK